MAYLLDSNVFIQAKNLHYGMDFCPAFWEWLEVTNDAGKVFSISQVFDELVAGNDEVAEWAKTTGNALFNDIDRATLDALKSLTQWLQVQHYRPGAIKTFLQAADPILIAYAMAHKHTVVTHEVSASSVKKVKIPNVCVGMTVPFMTPYEMLRRERAVFVLDAK